jgi:hypothetical protein
MKLADEQTGHNFPTVLLFYAPYVKNKMQKLVVHETLLQLFTSDEIRVQKTKISSISQNMSGK